MCRNSRDLLVLPRSSTIIAVGTIPEVFMWDLCVNDFFVNGGM